VRGPADRALFTPRAAPQPPFPAQNRPRAPPNPPPTPRWALAGVLYNYYTQQPDIAGLPQAEWRRWVVLLCWVSEGRGRPRAC
jgi:hypothetical protein